MRSEECESSKESELSDGSTTEDEREDSQLSGGERDGGGKSRKGELSFDTTFSSRGAQLSYWVVRLAEGVNRLDNSMIEVGGGEGGGLAGPAS